MKWDIDKMFVLFLRFFQVIAVLKFFEQHIFVNFTYLNQYVCALSLLLTTRALYNFHCIVISPNWSKYLRGKVCIFIYSWRTIGCWYFGKYYLIFLPREFWIYFFITLQHSWLYILLRNTLRNRCQAFFESLFYNSWRNISNL